MTRYQAALCAILFVFILVMNIAQPYPEVAPLQHGPTLLLLAASPWLLRRWPMSDRAVTLIVAFLVLHTIGGRWTYSNVPYDAWLNAAFGTDTAEAYNGQQGDMWDAQKDMALAFLGALISTPFILRPAPPPLAPLGS